MVARMAHWYLAIRVYEFLHAKVVTALVLASHHNSICPSVCLSHGWISQKRCKLRSPNLHHRLHGRLLFQDP